MSDKTDINKQDSSKFELAALVLRIGLGLVFFSGGLNKLILLLNSNTSDAMVNNYMGTAGYVNAFFTNYLFTGSLGEFLTPYGFLTFLSSLEFVLGVMLIIGFLVRPISLLSGFLLWTFVIALPTQTVPSVVLDVKTYTSPAMLVMIRDIALSGMMFALYNIGSGLYSIDNKYFAKCSCLTLRENINWDSLALLIRLSLGVVLIVGGLFSGLDHIQSFKTSALILTVLGFAIIFLDIKYLGYGLAALFLYYLVMKINFDKSIISYLNSVKRELALLAGALVLGYLGSGKSHIISFIKNK